LIQRGDSKEVTMNGSIRMVAAVACVGWSVAGCAMVDKPAAVAIRQDSVVAEIRAEAEALAPLMATRTAKDFLAAAKLLPNIRDRVLYRDAERKYYSAATANRLTAPQREALEEVKFDERFYYEGRYGTPVAYCRALDLVAGAGLGDLRGQRVLDFGYGMIGQLRMMALQGADVTGVEIQPYLPLLYGEAGDQGAMRGWGGRRGSVKLVHGRWPAEQDVIRRVGTGYDLILSKNTLKRGYIHPERPVDERMTVQLGVDDETYVRRTFGALKSGGYFLIYNLSPAQAPPDKPYIPWADGRCPFPRALLESAGFTVLAYDEDDTAFVRRMGRLLKWDEQGMDLENDLFAHYTLARKD
jgi:hypothetical protein